ncbi:MAG: GIY-YIG nuclease family protein, partial [Desulfobacteraceae bacterium]
GIRLDAYTFSGPYKLFQFQAPKSAGIYAILKDNPNKAVDVLYVGQTKDFSDRGLIRLHHRYRCFVENAGGEFNVMVAILQMPTSTEDQRKKVESRLIGVYNPPCNRTS